MGHRALPQADNGSAPLGRSYRGMLPQLPFPQVSTALNFIVSFWGTMAEKGTEPTKFATKLATKFIKGADEKNRRSSRQSSRQRTGQHGACRGALCHASWRLPSGAWGSLIMGATRSWGVHPAACSRYCHPHKYRQHFAPPENQKPQ